MNNNIEISNSSETCQTCGSELNGNFCSSCGEKKFNPKHDLSIIKFIEHSVDMYIHFDTKFFRTFKNLFFYPGQLTKDFISGRRVLFMKPMQLFVLASVIFYFLLPDTSAYYSRVNELSDPGTLMRYNTKNKIFEKTIKYHATENQIVATVNKNVIHSSKLFLFLIFPLWALIMFALFYKSNKNFVAHLVFSLHCFTFFIFLHMFYDYALSRFMNFFPLAYLLPLFLIFAFYMFVAIKKFYLSRITVSIIKSVVVCIVLIFLIEIYRESITMISLYFL